jgi:hypothetical protein
MIRSHGTVAAELSECLGECVRHVLAQCKELVNCSVHNFYSLRLPS